jgi:hypothetical protein
MHAVSVHEICKEYRLGQFLQGDTMLREAATHYAAARYAGADARSATRAIRDLRRAMRSNMRRSAHVSDKP